MKLIPFLIVISLSFPLVLAECFLFQENNFYCTDLSSQQAQNECALYPDCDPLTHLSLMPCQEIQFCQATEALPLPVIVQQNAVEELPIIRDSSSQEPIEEETSTLLWLLLSLVAFVVAVYYAFSKNLIPRSISKKKIEADAEELGLSSIWRPPNLNPKIQKTLHLLHKMHTKKARQHEIKSFLTEAGLAVDDHQKDIFSQVLVLSKTINRRKQKVYQQLSERERKVFEHLEQVIDLSKTVSKAKSGGEASYFHQEAIRKDLQKAITDLRKLAGRK